MENDSSHSLPSVEKGRNAHTPPSRWSRTPFYQRAILVVALIVVVLGLALGLGLGLGLKHAHSTSTTSSTTSSSNSAKLAVGATFDYALGFNMTVGAANSSTTFYSVDLQNTPAATISGLVSAGHFIACYFSAGSVESYRPDAAEIPEEAIGNVMDGWPDEKWLDVRNAGVRSVMAARIALAQTKGCLGIDADNIDGYSNDSGFDMTEDDAVDYIQFLAQAASNNSLVYGLKNGGDLIPRVLNVSGWVVNEQCAAFGECDLYEPFVLAGKPVFHVEYTEDETAQSVNASFYNASCAADAQPGFSTIIKHLDLDDWVVDCS